MIALAGLSFLPRKILLIISIGLIAGHNLLDNVSFSNNSWLHYIWAILHQREWLKLFGISARTSYPILSFSFS